MENKGCPFCGKNIVIEGDFFYAIHDKDCFLACGKTHYKVEYHISRLESWNERKHKKFKDLEIIEMPSIPKGEMLLFSGDIDDFKCARIIKIK